MLLPTVEKDDLAGRKLDRTLERLTTEEGAAAQNGVQAKLLGLGERESPRRGEVEAKKHRRSQLECLGEGRDEVATHEMNEGVGGELRPRRI